MSCLNRRKNGEGFLGQDTSSPGQVRHKLVGNCETFFPGTFVGVPNENNTAHKHEQRQEEQPDNQSHKESPRTDD
jgi:hypothetical protein